MVYALSRAFAARASAAAVTVLEAFDLVTGLEVAGFKGNGGGARSGSELSHLYHRQFSIQVFCGGSSGKQRLAIHRRPMELHTLVQMLALNQKRTADA